MNEQKKYDIGLLRTDLNNQIQTTVNNVKKEHKDIITDERRQVRRLDKIDQMTGDLEATKEQIRTQGETMKGLAEQANVSF